MDREISAVSRAPFKPWAIKPADASIERRSDGSLVIRSNHKVGPAPLSIAHLLREKAHQHPERPLLQERSNGYGPWRQMTYGGAWRGGQGIAQQLMARGFGMADSVMILSGNSIEHAVVMFGCYLAGVPVAPVSANFSLLSSGHAQLRHCFNTIRPRVVFAQSARDYAAAFAALRELDPNLIFVTARNEDGSSDVIALDQWIETLPTGAVQESLDRIHPQTVAKYLFTSGSTGVPKAVPQTQGMMTAVIAGLEGLRLPDPKEAPDFVPRTLEWMPWSHLAAGNINFNLAMANGGTIYLDDGKPVPGLFETTLRNLREVEPVEFASAPIAYGMLADAMEQDCDLRRAVFQNLRYMAYGGATLSNDLYERIQALAVTETGYRIPLTTMYGSTETQGITMTHWATDRAGLIGLPLPGIELKLVSNHNKLEVRVRGSSVMPGYHNDEARTAAAFDEEGFYKLGDAVRFVEESDVSQGLVFDGRVAEDFKLHTGTWVSVGVLRPEIVAACSPYVRDAVIAGQDRAFVTALLWPSAAAMEAFRGDDGALLLEPLANVLRQCLATHNATASGSSRRIERFAILTTPPSPEHGEIADKGYINQRVALENHTAQVVDLYRTPPPSHIKLVGRHTEAEPA